MAFLGKIKMKWIDEKRSCVSQSMCIHPFIHVYSKKIIIKIKKSVNNRTHEKYIKLNKNIYISGQTIYIFFNHRLFLCGLYLNTNKFLILWITGNHSSYHPDFFFFLTLNRNTKKSYRNYDLYFLKIKKKKKLILFSTWIFVFSIL